MSVTVNFGYKSYINGPWRLQVIDLFGVLVLGFRSEDLRDDFKELYEGKGYHVTCWYADCDEEKGE